MPGTDRPSKTARKREMHALQELGEQLAALPESEFAQIALPEPLRGAVLEARRLKSREALRRQLQYVGRLMRDADAGAIRAALALGEAEAARANARHRLIEQWRERLISEPGALQEFAGSWPAADLARLRGLAQAAARERAAGRPPRHYRELFHALRGLLAGEPGAGTDL